MSTQEDTRTKIGTLLGQQVSVVIHNKEGMYQGQLYGVIKGTENIFTLHIKDGGTFHFNVDQIYRISAAIHSIEVTI